MTALSHTRPAQPGSFALAALALITWAAALVLLPGVGGDALAMTVLAGHQVAASLIECATLTALAGWHRARLDFGPTLAVLLALSVTQALTLHLAAAARTWPEATTLLAWLAGPGVLHVEGEARDGFALAFTHAGLLTVLRLAGTTAWLVRCGSPLRRAGLTVLACYGSLRLATAWTADLVRGASPLG